MKVVIHFKKASEVRTLNSYERLMNRIQGKPVDRVPNMNIVMQFAARETGHCYGQVVRNARLLADGMLRCHEKYGIDCLWTISDSVREPQDLGAEVIVPDNGVPYCPQPFITGPEDFHKLKLMDPASGRAMGDRLEAVRILKEEAKGEVPVIGWVEGAVAAACNMMGVANFMYMMMDEPEAAQELLAFCGEQELRFALAQVQAGADIIGLGDAAASLIGPDMYEEFAIAHEKRIFAEVHKAGALTKLHICGNINPILEQAAGTGCDILDCDHMVDMARACELMRGKGCACGNFDPVSIALQGSREDVFNASIACAKLGDNSIVAAGCEIPIDTDPANMLATHEALCSM